MGVGWLNSSSRAESCAPLGWCYKHCGCKDIEVEVHACFPVWVDGYDVQAMNTKARHINFACELDGWIPLFNTSRLHPMGGDGQSMCDTYLVWVWQLLASLVYHTSYWKGLPLKGGCHQSPTSAITVPHTSDNTPLPASSQLAWSLL
jgi:hypothetical protein